MIQLNKSINSDQFIVVTLTELTTINNPFYLFVFKHIETKKENKIILSSADDLSDYKYRFNKWKIDKSIFSNWQEGQYLYDSYEQSSSTDMSVADKNKVESGKMNLLSNDRFIFAEYNTQTTFKSYDGQ